MAIFTNTGSPLFTIGILYKSKMRNSTILYWETFMACKVILCQVGRHFSPTITESFDLRPEFGFVRAEHIPISSQCHSWVLYPHNKCGIHCHLFHKSGWWMKMKKVDFPRKVVRELHSTPALHFTLWTATMAYNFFRVFSYSVTYTLNLVKL